MVYTGDCIGWMRTIPSNSIHAFISDWPSGKGFMGRAWDKSKGGKKQWTEWMRDVMLESYRVMLPGAYGFAWSSTTTDHWAKNALDDSGFIIVDTVYHMYLTGFPKSHNISMAIDDYLGVEREKVWIPIEHVRNPKSIAGGHGVEGGDRPYMQEAKKNGGHWMKSNKPVSPESLKWDGYGTRLKPGVEGWILFQKPVEKTFANNVLRHGVGGLNIRGCRIGDDPGGWGGGNGFANTHAASEYGGMREGDPRPVEGKWPANVVFSHHQDCLPNDDNTSINIRECVPECQVLEASRQINKDISKFYYVPKPDRTERDAGLSSIPSTLMQRVNPGGFEHDPKFASIIVKNDHETVKPIDLMRYLCRLITPPGGTILDPFSGSGTTGIGAILERFSYIGVELRPDHSRNSRHRIWYWNQDVSVKTQSCDSQREDSGLVQEIFGQVPVRGDSTYSNRDCSINNGDMESTGSIGLPLPSTHTTMDQSIIGFLGQPNFFTGVIE